jgi:hypothetical protein
LPPAFYITVAVLLLGIFIFTAYLNTNRRGLRTALRIGSVLYLLCSIALQIVLIITFFPQGHMFPLNYAIAIIIGMFLFCTVLTLLGILQEKL